MLHNPFVVSVVSSLASVITAVAITAIAKALKGLRDDQRRFMREHLYLLRVTDWGKVNLVNVFEQLDIQLTEPPPILPLDSTKGR
jgi:hypothetical protein